jgi:hypothetical protein
LFISSITSTWEGVRWGFRGITGEGKRGNGRRYLGRDEMDIQRENRLGKWGNGSIHFNFLSTSPSLFFFGVWHSWNALDCSDTEMRMRFCIKVP